MQGAEVQARRQVATDLAECCLPAEWMPVFAYPRGASSQGSQAGAAGLV